MARFLLCLAFVVGLAACTDGDGQRGSQLTEARATLQILGRDLAEARDRIDELERQILVEGDRYVDLWDGGPTMRGPLLALPRLGVMSWSCDDDDYGFRIVFTVSAASVRVAYDAPDLSTDATVHPGRRVGATVAAGESVAWTITHRHPPGFVRARIEVTTARSRHGNCLLPDVTVEETGRVYD